MRVVIPIESRFKLSNGRPSSPHLNYERFWKRYLSVFEEVVVLARLFKEEDANGLPIEGPGVIFQPIPPYVGPWGFLKNRVAIQRQVRKLCSDDQAYILRVPGTIGDMVHTELMRRGLPYGVEVVGDPHDVFAPGAIKHPLRPYLRWAGSRNLQRLCRNAVAAAYVTAEALQKRYPVAPGRLSINYSSVELHSKDFVSFPRQWNRSQSAFHVLSIGSMEQRYKAFDVLIEAIRQCVAGGVDVRLTILGEGRHRTELEEQARQSGIESRVAFTGRLAAGDAVRQKLDSADLFVLPSRTEGLPRALIEAMSRGLPCIGTRVGGIPELLHEDCLVEPNSPQELASRIQNTLNNPEVMNLMACRNLETAQEYEATVLQARRQDFYEAVKWHTQKHFQVRHRAA